MWDYLCTNNGSGTPFPQDNQLYLKYSKARFKLERRSVGSNTVSRLHEAPEAWIDDDSLEAQPMSVQEHSVATKNFCMRMWQCTPRRDILGRPWDPRSGSFPRCLVYISRQRNDFTFIQ